MLQIIKYSTLSYNLILQSYIYKTTQLYKFFVKTNSLTFCGQITENYFNISADQFFLSLLLILQMFKLYIFARRSQDFKTVKPFIAIFARRSADDVAVKPFINTNDVTPNSI